jgi:formylglycine-generating enzyme required for sulfatase activity
MCKIMAKGVTWTMGSTTLEKARSGIETSHQVTLTNNYYIGVYPVTQTQWQQITGYNPSKFTAERMMRPVEMVSYADIRQGTGTKEAGASATGGVYPDEPYGNSFLGLLRNKTGIDFDLPSEAQWEFAARAGNGEGYWGDGSVINISSSKDSNLNLLGRYLSNPTSNSSAEPAASIAPSVGGTAIVGSYAPNAWGLYDVHGNVWEWCLDWYASNIADLNGAVNTSGSYRILRGGSWLFGASDNRPARRRNGTPTNRFEYHGFRVACTAGLQ